MRYSDLFRKAVALLLPALFLIACSVPGEEEAAPRADNETDRTEVYSVDLAAAAKAPTGAETDETFLAAVTDFSETLFQKCARKGENLILSPLSVTYALTLTANGASGETLEEFNTLNSGIDVSQMNEYLFQSALRLASSGESKVNISNSIWADKGFAINEQFKWIAQQYYNASAANADFSGDAADIINQWVSDKTDGMIDKAMESISPNTVMILVNTVLFDGVWEKPYPEYLVYEGTFHNYDGTESPVEMMYSYELSYFTVDGYTGFSKAYLDGYRFIAILPDEGADVYEFAANFDWNTAIDTALNGSHDRADCTIPKFTYESELPLTEILQDMGLKRAFASDAELNGLAAGEGDGLSISSVNQKAKIILNESGTKAAAYTEVAIEECEYPSIRFDRPFLYAIVEGETGLPLFMGILATMG